ncbi:MAG: class I SAM-dependent methyltransferase [bacterium]|nr:class I SAM-dependent methyltransferase [bacterium]
MDDKTITRLANITTSFYTKTAKDFSASRSMPWEGWEQLVPAISKIRTRPVRVLDIACGNGRFAHFLSQKCPNTPFEYVGIDNNDELLRDAKKQKVGDNITTAFHSTDIIRKLQQAEKLIASERPFDLVVAFGFLHHVPSTKLREQLFLSMAEQGTDTSYFVVTFWDFISSQRLEKKQVDPSILGIDHTKLEVGDYILDWQRGTAALRYANHTMPKERYHLAKQSGLKLVDEFRADGKEHNLNHYLVLQK